MLRAVAEAAVGDAEGAEVRLEAVQATVVPVECDLQDAVQLGQGGVASDLQPPDRGLGPAQVHP